MFSIVTIFDINNENLTKTKNDHTNNLSSAVTTHSQNKKWLTTVDFSTSRLMTDLY